MFKRTLIIYLVICLIMTLSTLASHACEFYFNYEEIVAPLGVTGSIGIRVFKDHSNCSMPDMDGYDLQWKNIQVIEETGWEEVSTSLHEKWIRVVLSEIGQGYFMISKDCTTEGYDSKSIPITVTNGGDLWNEVVSGQYPYETELSLKFINHFFEVDESATKIDRAAIIIENKAIALPSEDEMPDFTTVLESIYNYDDTISIYYSEINGVNRALLIAGKTFFYRLDHYL